MLDALRHFLVSYRTELTERFAREDVEWGLRGDESGAEPPHTAIRPQFSSD